MEGPVNGQIDIAYRGKYRGSSYLKPMIGVHARSTAVGVMPRETTKA